MLIYFSFLAINYPSAMLNRTVNYLSKEICAFVSFPKKNTFLTR